MNVNGSNGNGGVQLANGGGASHSSGDNGGPVAAQAQNGASAPSPELPHVTANIIPLSNVLRFYTQETYRQLVTMIENLSMAKDSDVSRKKKFLQLIVGLRQDFVKIYTLVKWAAVSNDIGKLIDLLNWFRGQDFFFEQLTLGLNELNRFGGAKLPNSDLYTSLEILIKGRPQLPSYNMIKDKPISPQKIMQVLQDLNLLLTTRMALNDNIPLEFLNNYVVKDGRINFHIPSKFEVSITIGNDILIESESDYHQSPYYFIDFSFLFGINNDGMFTTSMPSKLPEAFFGKFEKSCNQILLASNLSGLYDFLIKFCSNYKLNLIYQQLKIITSEIKWSKSIKFKFNANKTIITLHYWNSQSFKSYMEISIDKHFNLNIDWFKNGKYYQNNAVEINNDEFNIEHLLALILNKHCELLMSSIFEKFKQPFVSLINPHQLLIKLSTKRQAILSINASSGIFFFNEPSLSEIQLIKRVNNYNFNGSETLLADYIINNLVELKLQRLSKEVHNKLITIEWISNSIIKFKDSELKKMSEKAKNYRIQFYRFKNWPSSWFLINLINDRDYEVEFFVSRIKSIKGEWKIEWSSNLHLTYSPTFDFFSNLSNVCSNKIIHNMIIDELLKSNIQFLKLEDNSLMKKLNLNSADDKEYDLDFCLFNGDGRFLPVKNSSSCLFLKIRSMKSDSKDIKLQVKIKGKINLNFDQFRNFDFKKLNINIEVENKSFEVSRNLNLENFNNNVKLTTEIFSSMNQFNMLITIINELWTNNIEISLNADNQIQFSVNDLFKDLSVELPLSVDRQKSFVLKYNGDASRRDVQLVLDILNDGGDQMKFSGIINYLVLITPVLNGINSGIEYVAEKSTESLPNGLNKLHCDVRIRNLNSMDILFKSNQVNNNNPKSVITDKILVSTKFALNKFYKNKIDNLNLVVSLFNNINLKNPKNKKLFEMISKEMNSLEEVTCLNYDFLMDASNLQKALTKICDCMVAYVEMG